MTVSGTSCESNDKPGRQDKAVTDYVNVISSETDDKSGKYLKHT